VSVSEYSTGRTDRWFRARSVSNS